MKVMPERPVDPAHWRRHLNERLRAEFIAGAEEESRQRTGLPMTAEPSGTPRRFEIGSSRRPLRRKS